MSYRFASFIANANSSAKEGGRTVTPKSPYSSTSAFNNNSNTSRSRVNRPAARTGSSQSPVKRVMKPSGQTTSVKKSSTVKHASNRPLSAQSGASAQSKNSIPKKKSSVKCSKSPAAARPKTTFININESPNTNNNGESTLGSDLRKTVETLGMSTENIPKEGPVFIREADFDFYSILMGPKSWNCEEDETGVKISSCSTNANERKTPPITAGECSVASEITISSSQRYSFIRRHESDIWGGMRTSTAETSNPPSLTSVSDDEQKADFVDDRLTTKGNDEEMIRDENNNMLENNKSNLCRNNTFCKVTNSPTTITTRAGSSAQVVSSEHERKEIEGDDSGANMPAIRSTSNPDHIKGSEEPPNAQLCIDNNNHISPTPTELLLPLKVDEQLNKVSSVNIRRVESQQDFSCLALESQQCLQTKLENMYDMTAAKECTSLEATFQLMTNKMSEEIKNSSSPVILGTLNGERVDLTATEEYTDHQSHYFSVSTKSSYISAAADGDGEYLLEEMENNRKLDSQETQTESKTSIEAETNTDECLWGDGRKRKPALSLVMAVNEGVDILPSEQERKSQLRGILKTSQPLGVNIDEMPDYTKHPLEFVSERNRDHFSFEEITYPQTFTQEGVDYGFPTRMSISGIIGKTLWGSTEKRRAGNCDTLAQCDEENNISIVGENNEGSKFITTAYDILNTGWKFASDFIGAEEDLEPREDYLRYNGYKIRVRGKKLLLESLHVNCDFEDGYGSSNHSATSLRSLDRESNRKGRRVRIVVRVTEPFVDDEKDGQSIKVVEHNVHHTDGKWTFIHGGNGESKGNFIEIGCPTGVHPESLAFGVRNGLILVEAP